MTNFSEKNDLPEINSSGNKRAKFFQIVKTTIKTVSLAV